MALDVGTVLRVVATLIWLDGNLNQNVFNATIAGSGGPYDEDEVADDMLDWVEAMYLEIVGSLSDEVDGSQVQVYEYDAIDDDWDEVGTKTWSYDPAVATDQLPRGVALLINCRTIDPDVQGKKYLGGYTELAVTDGLFGGGSISQAADFADVWLTAFMGATSGADFQPVIWSPTGTTAKLVTGDFSIATIPAYQRRRKRGVGV